MAKQIQLDREFAERYREVTGLPRTPKTWEELRSMIAEKRGEDYRNSLRKVSEGEAVYGGSKTRTRHRLIFGDRSSKFVYCAADALITGLLRRSLRVESVCPHCGEKMSLTIEDQEITDTTHQSMILYFGISDHGRGSFKRVCCPFINFFPSHTHLTEWLRKNRNVLGVKLTLQDAVDSFRNHFKEVLAPNHNTTSSKGA